MSSKKQTQKEKLKHIIEMLRLVLELDDKEILQSSVELIIEMIEEEIK